ncbi:hypothetical protein SBD_5909 [Streptomyces bottropensis ATCC 25435]|uniref:Uncharacterized protein n=1 Tax=Streptomyces bottropensis ATCC 25435 TaxID=1054862 RepID=M3EUN1_9ACTN|nr:hypothetical protein SBD_5909 [Streptomyces bottropensis ATCC 25435]
MLTSTNLVTETQQLLHCGDLRAVRQSRHLRCCHAVIQEAGA